MCVVLKIEYIKYSFLKGIQNYELEQYEQTSLQHSSVPSVQSCFIPRQLWHVRLTHIPNTLRFLIPCQEWKGRVVPAKSKYTDSILRTCVVLGWKQRSTRLVISENYRTLLHSYVIYRTLLHSSENSQWATTVHVHALCVPVFVFETDY